MKLIDVSTLRSFVEGVANKAADGFASGPIIDQVRDELGSPWKLKKWFRASSIKTGRLYDFENLAGLSDDELLSTYRNFLSGSKVPVARKSKKTSAPVPSNDNNSDSKINLSMGVESLSVGDNFVPQKDANYVRWGYFSDLNQIIKSESFFPVYISGLSGNGKTMMVEQVCANLNREYIRVQINPETDEDDLIGGFRLVKGETVFQKGPVIRAMERGAILLIDEIDRATNKIMCLQGIVEGKPVLLKKTGEIVHPAKGFNVIATANTKGKGSEDGRFSAAGILDEAFLERFVITLEQTFPSAAIENKIVTKLMNSFDCVDEEFAKKLVDWAFVIRKTYFDDGIDELISTRRLAHIVQTFSVFKDRMKAIEFCINRFDDESKSAFLDLYTKIDQNALNVDGSVNEKEMPF